MILSVAVTHRPFSVEITTGLQLPDGIFDGALTLQSINCFLINTSGQDIQHLSVYLEGVSDAGIVPDSRTVDVSLLRAGETHLCSWPCDFSQSLPGKTLLSIKAQAPGFEPRRILKKIFVSRTRYDWASGQYVCRVPEGELQMLVAETSGPRSETRPGDENKVHLAGPWIIRRFSANLHSVFSGQYGPLPYSDPWWKVVAWIIAAIAGIAAVIFASEGKGTAKTGVQCDFDEKTGQTTNCRTPDPQPTTGPTEKSPAAIASAIANTAVAVGMADEIDPWRRGQEATPVRADEITSSQMLQVTLSPLDSLEAGKPSPVRCDWLYTRVTNLGVYHATGTDERTNSHLLASKTLTAPARVNYREQHVPVNAVFERPNGDTFKGSELFVTLIVRPPQGQGGEFRLVLTDTSGSGNFRGEFNLAAAAGQLSERRENFIGTWRLFVIAQDINLAPDGLAPEQAARIIGGFPIAAPIAVTLDPGPCPIIAADAQMDVYA